MDGYVHLAVAVAGDEGGRGRAVHVLQQAGLVPLLPLQQPLLALKLVLVVPRLRTTGKGIVSPDR